jgi:hypothetical protein
MLGATVEITTESEPRVCVPKSFDALVAKGADVNATMENGRTVVMNFPDMALVRAS